MKHTSINETSLLTDDMSSIDVSGASEAETPSPQQGSANLANHNNKAKTAMGALLGLLAFGVGGVTVYSWGGEAASPPHHDLSSNQSLIKQASASRADAEKRGERTKFSTAEGDAGNEAGTTLSVFDTNARSLTTEGEGGMVLLGDGECRRGNGQNSLQFKDTSRRTLETVEICRAKCLEYSDWCLGVEFDLWGYCHLVTDLKTFQTAGHELQNNEYDGLQTIDDTTYTTENTGCLPSRLIENLCNDWYEKYGEDRMDCPYDNTCATVENTAFEGGSLYPRKDFQCWLSPLAKSTAVSSKEGDTYLGEGMCTRGNGGLILKFEQWQGNVEVCRAKCLAEYSDWCLGVEMQATPGNSHCSLVTDLETFQAAGHTLQNNKWTGAQIIDGTAYQTWCPDNISDNACATVQNTAFEGGGLYPRTGWHCWLSPLAKSTELN